MLLHNVLSLAGWITQEARGRQSGLTRAHGAAAPSSNPRRQRPACPNQTCWGGTREIQEKNRKWAMLRPFLTEQIAPVQAGRGLTGFLENKAGSAKWGNLSLAIGELSPKSPGEKLG